jgi:MurNAc alpha-1-phosphate uridylyltransferase
MPHATAIAFFVGVKIGFRYERPHEDGASHFLEHMLFEGTERRPSSEHVTLAVESAGGIINALPLLGEYPFLVVNGDIWCDYDFSTLPELQAGIQAHLVLVDNPEHNPDGDFALQDGLIKNTGETMLTFSGIGIYSTDFFAEQSPGAVPLAPIIRDKSDNDLVSGQHHKGLWTDVGTIERLNELELQLT